jgi:hypothetical protein
MMKRTDMKTLIRATAIVVAASLGAAVTGPYELRGQTGDPAVTVVPPTKPVRVIEGRFTEDVRLTSHVDWVLRGYVFIAAPARIVIESGANVTSDLETNGSLVIGRGAGIDVAGTLDAPLIYASDPFAFGGITDTPPHGVRALPRASSSAPVAAMQPVRETAAPAQSREAAATRQASVPRLVSDGGGTPATGDLPIGRPAGIRRALSGATALTGRTAMRRAEAGSLSADIRRPQATGHDGTEGTRQVVGPPEIVAGLDKPVRVIHGRFTSDLRLTSDTYWVLRGAVFVGEPARIVIDPGTRVVGETATQGTLIIERGAQIIADGTAAAPIVFTSDQPVGQRGRGDWGGLIINGRAPVNLTGGVGIGEGDTGIYGGSDPDDSSGILRYVRVEFAGIEFSPDNELNGIAFQGVGRGTVVDHIQVAFNKDDGIEMFGGTVDVKHVVLTGIGDDSMDWTFGWQGRAQFVIVQQRGDDADRGIEADNNANNNDLLPRSKPTIYNLTLIGDPDHDEGSESTVGMTLREGTAGIIRNFIVTGFKSSGIALSTSSTLAQVASGQLSARHGIVFGNGANFHSSAATLVTAAGGTIDQVDPQLVRPFDHVDPIFRPRPGSVAMLLGFETPPNDGFFDDSVAFRGALSDDPAEDWTLGWTSYAQR